MDSNALFAVLAIAACLIVFGLLIAGAVLMVRDTIRQRGVWGINLTTPYCRHCREPMPVMRVPANFRQGFWGGWTCSECGLEVDKWGEPLPNQTGPAKWRLPPDDPRYDAPPAPPAQQRHKNPTDDAQRGGDFHD
jgi:hypothetical protein